ncbi:MAG TPA: CBS domain-containing protein [Acetobacteraceae bacterium]|nr:CBS domain-containing protein [Acetobacteraceae bacterium]
MKINDVLRDKRNRIVSVRMHETVRTAAKLLRSENIGAIVVKDTCETEGDVVLGMLSERDLLRALVDQGQRALELPVSALMTRTVISCTPQDDLDHVVDLMARHHIRHVPVLDNEALVGVMSIRDLLAVWQSTAGSGGKVAAPA